MIKGSKEYKIKLVLLGEGRVGKTSLVVRFTQHKFAQNYKPSLGVDFMAKESLINDKKIKFLLFDAAGQDHIAPLRKRYYTGAHGAVIVYDVTRRHTFERVERWLDEMQGEIGNVITTLVGNKIDLENREVTRDEAKAYADKKGLYYMETSALSGANVEKLFVNYAGYILDIDVHEAYV